MDLPRSGSSYGSEQLRRVDGLDANDPAAAKVFLNRFPHRRAGINLGRRGPTRNTVALAGFEQLSPDAQIRGAMTGSAGGGAGITEPARAHHIATLPIVRVLREQLVGNIFH